MGPEPVDRGEVGFENAHTRQRLGRGQELLAVTQRHAAIDGLVESAVDGHQIPVVVVRNHPLKLLSCSAHARAPGV